MQLSPNEMKRGYSDTFLGQVHYRNLGIGPPLLCVHATTYSSSMFTKFASLMADEYHIIEVDLPDSGTPTHFPTAPVCPNS